MRTAVLLSLLLLLAPPVAAGADPDPPSGQGFDAFFLLQGVGRIASQDPAGLGAEAAVARDWAQGRESLSLLTDGDRHWLADADERHALSPELGEGLRRLRDYMRLSAKSRLAPVTTAELREAAARSEASIRALFQRSLDEAIVLDGEPIAPELGGDALLVDGRLELRTLEDPTRGALVAVARRQDDPDALAALFAEQPESLALLDPNGQLEREVRLYRERAERGVPLERRRRPFDMAVETILRNGSDSITMRPREQLESIFAHEWTRGRLVGLWHLHPPAWGEESLASAHPPSPDDRQIARVNGQFLTVVFRPDGFDLYDLQTSPLGPAPPATAERRIELRSADWRAHFARSQAAWKERLTTSP